MSVRIAAISAVPFDFNFEVQRFATFRSGPFHGYGAAPPNKGMELKVKSVTVRAKKRAMLAFRAALPRH